MADMKNKGSLVGKEPKGKMNTQHLTTPQMPFKDVSVGAGKPLPKPPKATPFR